MPHIPLLYEFLPLYLAQAALTVWMLVDCNRRGVESYWFWIILWFQPFGAWVYFFLYKTRDFQGGQGWLAGLFQRRPSLEELRRQVERSPTVASRLELGAHLVEVGDFADALAHVEAVLAREPEHCQALFLLAECRRGLGQPGDALPPLQKVLERQPTWDNYRAWRTLIEVRRETGDMTGALDSCRELARAMPSLEHTCLLAEQLLDAGEKVEARSTLEQKLEDFRYLPSLSRRRDRPWRGKARQLLKHID
jgi:hypothetical protein